LTPEMIASILVQIPIVALFIWYSDRKDKQFQAFLREQRQEDREQQKENNAVLVALTTRLGEHDIKTDKAIATMEERTRPAPRRRKLQDDDED